MNRDNFSPENFERFLHESAPALKKLIDNPPDMSLERIGKLKQKLESHHPFLRILTKSQMRKLCLELFKERPMDGTDLAAMLRKNNVKLKGTTGEGEIYGLLQQLENAKAIESEWKDGIARQKRIYKLTDAGRAELQRLAGEESALAQAMLARAAS